MPLVDLLANIHGHYGTAYRPHENWFKAANARSKQSRADSAANVTAPERKDDNRFLGNSGKRPAARWSTANSAPA
jgi:hypothetical protein